MVLGLDDFLTDWSGALLRSVSRTGSQIVEAA